MHPLDGDRRHQEGGVVVAVLDELHRLGRVTRVAEAGEVVDVLVAHAERALEDQRLQYRSVQPSVGLRVAGERLVRKRLVLQGQPERLAEVGIDVPEPDVVGWFGCEVFWTLQALDVEVPPDRGGEGLMLIGSQPAEEAMGGKHGQTWVLEGDEAHEHVPVLALTSHLIGVDARGLVAVMPVGDEQLGRA